MAKITQSEVEDIHNLRINDSVWAINGPCCIEHYDNGFRVIHTRLTEDGELASNSPWYAFDDAGKCIGDSDGAFGPATLQELGL